MPPQPDLSNTTALVAGGAGAVGEGVARALLRAGAVVVVPSRSPERLTALDARLSDADAGRLHLVEGNPGDPDAALALRDHVAREVGPLDLVVASLGGWSQGRRVVETDPETWDRVVEGTLRAHYACVRAFLPGLVGRRPATYVFLAGLAGLVPVPGAGPVSAAVAAEIHLARVVQAEHARVRVHALVLGPVLTRRRPTGPPDALAADDVGDLVAHLHTAPDPAGRSPLVVQTTRDRDALVASLHGPHPAAIRPPDSQLGTR